MADEVKSKQGEPLAKGDHVKTKFRGGRHEGEVEKIVTTEEQADEEGVKNPPKVLFHDQNDKRVAHNPATLDRNPGENYPQSYEGKRDTTR